MSINKGNTLRCIAGALLLFFFISVKGQTQSELLKAQEFLSSGNALLQKGKLEEAIAAFNEVVAILPKMPIGYINRGVAYAANSRFTEALSDADRVLSLGAEDASSTTFRGMAYQIKGHVYQAQGNLTASIEGYSKAIELVPRNAKFYNGRGISYMMLEQDGLARKDFDKAIEIDPSLSQFYVNRAVILRRAKEFNAAILDLDEALKLDPSNATAYLNRGNNHRSLKKLDEAIANYTKAISIEPKSEQFYNRAVVHFELKDYQAAVNDNTEAIRLDPKSSRAFKNRSLSYRRLGKVSLALEDLRKAIQLSDNSMSARYNLAYLLYETGRFVEARDEVTLLIGKVPLWKAPFLLRAEIHAKSGNLAKAREDRATAATLNADWKPQEDDFLVFDMTFTISGELK